MNGVQRAQRPRPPAQPAARGLVVSPLCGDVRVEARPEVIEKLLPVRVAFAAHISLTRTFLARAEKNSTSTGSLSAGVAAKGSLGSLTQGLRTVVRHYEAGVDVHQ